jgi:hypothetical protein
MPAIVNSSGTNATITTTTRDTPSTLLYDQLGNPMPQIGFKNGFCVLDLECSGGGTAKYGCGNMGITAGCGDIYSSGLSLSVDRYNGCTLPAITSS